MSSAARGTAVVMMDFQNTIVAMIAEPARSAVLQRAQRVLEAARAQGVPVLHVAVRFRPGHPEVASANLIFAGIRAAGLLVEGTEGAAIHATLAPRDDEPVVVKRRVGAFGTTDLDALLRARGAHRLVLCGLVTSGVVLSTVRTAADLDYGLVVVGDACADADDEVHRVLTSKVLARQASIVAADQVDALLAQS
jgi:nicotinamidase-related amidase